MTINVIHDLHRRDRQVLLDSEIIEHGLEVKYWPAIIDPQFTARGISRAHKQIVRWAQAAGEEMVCIAEDDMHLCGPGAWQHFLNNMPTDFDLYLAGVYYGTIKGDMTVDDFCALTLYVVHERFYHQFLGIQDEQNLDRALARKGKFRVCVPFAVVQHAGYSDHKKAFRSYDHHLKGYELCCQL